MKALLLIVLGALTMPEKTPRFGKTYSPEVTQEMMRICVDTFDDKAFCECHVWKVQDIIAFESIAEVEGSVMKEVNRWAIEECLP